MKTSTETMHHRNMYITIYFDYTRAPIQDVNASILTSEYVLTHKEEFSPEFVMFAIEAKMLNTSTLERIIEKKKKQKASMAHKVGMKYKKDTTTAQAVRKVAKALDVSLHTNVSLPILVQAGAQGTGKKK